MDSRQARPNIQTPDEEDHPLRVIHQDSKTVQMQAAMAAAEKPYREPHDTHEESMGSRINHPDPHAQKQMGG